MSIVTPITSQLVLKNLQYAEEAVYGIFPTNPVMNWAGYGFATWRTSKPPLAVGHSLEEGTRFFTTGSIAPSLSFVYNPTNSTLAKYGVNAAGGGSGTIDKSLSFLGSAKLGGTTGTETFLQMDGVRPADISISGGFGQRTEIRMNLWGQNFPTPATSNPIGTGTFATDPNANPWSYYDGGTTPFTIGGFTPDVERFTLNVNRNLLRVYHSGEQSQRFLIPGNRAITGTMTLLWEDTNQFNNFSNATNYTIVWNLKLGTSVLTLTGVRSAQLDKMEWGDPKKTIRETYSYMALGAVLT